MRYFTVKVFSHTFLALGSMCFGLQEYSFSNAEENFFEVIETTSDEQNFFEVDVKANFETAREEDLTGSIVNSISYGLNKPSDYFLRNSVGVERFNTNMDLGFKRKISENLRVKVGGMAELEWGSFRDGRYEFDGAEISAELRDFYADLTLQSGTWLRLGNQVISRGEVDSIIVTDVLSPRDNSRPGQAELIDMRRHVPAILVSIPVSYSIVELLTTFNAGADKVAADRRSFDSNVLFGGQDILFVGGNVSENWETMLRAKFKINGGDIAITLGQVNWDQYSIKSPDQIEMVINNQVSSNNEITFGYDRVSILGISGNLARSEYLFKYELAYHSGRTFPKAENFLTPWEPYDLTVFGFGLEYAGISDIVLGTEFNGVLINDHDVSLNSDRTETGYLVQARWNTLNDLLSAAILHSKFNGDASSVSSLTVDYDLTDSLSVGGRVVLYEAKTMKDFLYPYIDQDVVKLSATYSF